MASEHFEVKSYWKTDKKKYSKKNVICNQRESDTTMKFSKRLESPPPKPPRRRYSDQLSVSTLGTPSNKKHNEETVKIKPKLREHSQEPEYLSLPANFNSKDFTECSDTSASLSQSLSLFDQLKQSKESDCYGKNATEDGKVAESEIKQIHSRNAEKFQEIDYAHFFRFGNSIPFSFDKFSQNYIGSNRVLITDNCTSKNLQSFHKDCHRRHNSDPVISHFNLQSGDLPLFDQEECCDNICSSNRKVNKICGYTKSCSCCKRRYLFTQEIKILKETNEKLWQHLCSLLKYVENIQKKVYDECSDISISGLLSSVYYAQKARDCAMEERLRIALEERDMALNDYDDLIHFMSKSFDCVDGKTAEKDIKELVAEIESTCNPSKLLKNQRMLLTHIYKLKELKKSCLSQQLKEAEIERNSALDKVRKLEEEIKDLKLSYDIWHVDNKHWEFTIFDILNKLMHQRDSILSKLDNGLDLSNIMYWPPKTSKLESLEHQNASQFESHSNKIESIKNHHLNDYKSKKSCGTSDEVAKLKEEIFLLNKSLESEMKKREMAEEKCVKLERLTHILRKKLNGQNIGVLV